MEGSEKILHLAVQFLVVVHLLVDLLVSVHDGRVISVAELGADMLPGVAGNASGEEDCYVAGVDDWTLSRLSFHFVD